MTKINSICIIDDDPITVFGIKRVLSKIVECNHLSTYENGKEAIDGIKALLAENMPIPKIIFLDINMPIMDGWQFLEEFISLSIASTVRINIVTSSIDIVDKEKWEFYKTKTHHTLEFKNKPIQRKEIQKITIAA